MEDPENLGAGMAGAGDSLVKQYPPAIHQFLEVPYNQCHVLFDGKIVDLLREVKGGLNVGTCVMEPLGGGAGRMEVEFRNENLIARLDGETMAIVPDLICILDRESGEPITTEGVRYGQRVKVVAVSAAPIMRTPEALAVFGPRMFGFDEDFTPIEDLVAGRAR